MKTKIKLLFKLFMVTLFFTFSSCEKDLYEDAIPTPERQNKINYVTIDEVPFLIPKIQEFNHDYDYLTQASKTTNKDALYLNLDLNKILEYVTENGLKSYSIKIKNQFEETDDRYFENLNIYEKEGKLQSFILKYNSIEDDKEFNFSTFTGEIDLYDLDKNLAGTLQYQNGVNKCIKIVIGHWHILDFGGGDIYAWNDGGGGSGSGSGGEGGSGSGGGGGSGSGSGGPGSGSSGTGSSGTGGTGTGGTGTGGTGTGGTGSGHTGGGAGGSSPVAPNPVTQAEQWVYNLDSGLMSLYSEQFFTLSNEAQTLMINYIIQNNYTGTNLMNAKYFLKSLISNHNGAFNFLVSSSVEIQTSVFNYLIQNNFNSSSANFTNQCITQMINNPGLELDLYATSKSPAFIDLSKVKDTSAVSQNLDVFMINYYNQTTLKIYL